MIHVLDRQQDKIIATFDKGQVYRAQFRADNQLLMVLELEVPLIDSRVKHLAKRERLIIEDESRMLQELIIFETDTDTVKGIKYVYCHAAYVDIGKAKIIDPVTLTGQTATMAAEFVVSGTRYQVGRVEGTGFRTYTVEKPSNPYQQLLAIATLFGLKLQFRIEVSGNQVTGRYVDLLERLGRDNGKEVVFGKDLVGLRRREDSSRIVTALKCYGPEQSDGNRLMVIVTDDDARQRWSTDGNHLWDIYEPQSDDAEMTQARLTQLGETELKKRIDSVVEYDVQHYDMSHIPGFAHEASYLHDTIRVKDEQYEPPLYLQAEVIEVEYDLFDQDSKKSKLGQFIEYDAEDILKQVQAYIAKNAARIIRSDVPPEGRDNLFWVDTSQDPEFMHTWNGTDWVAARGPQGPKGDKGDTGPQGPTGLQGVQGPKGDQGVQGPIGADGQSSYTHIAYANNATGTSGFSVSDSTNKLYIGIYVDSNPTDSNNPALYNWTLIKGQDGTQGLPGPKGDNGQTPYFHTAWANSADGTSGFSTTDSVNKLYLGTYTDFVSADSTNPTSYSWTKIKGETGAQGPQGPKGDQGIQGLQGPKGDQGIQGPVGSNGQTSYFHIKYAPVANPTAAQMTETPDVYIGTYVDFVATDSTDPTKYTWARLEGIKGDQGIPGTNGTNGQTSYLHIAYATNATGTAGFSTTDGAGKTYIGQYTDFVSADSTDPTKYTWTLIQGPQGPQGVPGVQGPAGPNGQSLYTWVKYATSATGANMSDLPDGKTYIGFAYNKTTSTESTNPADYTWAKIEGPQGVQGATGPNGQTLYTWLKYADSPTSGMSDSPTGKLYMGLAYNKTTSVESTNYADYSWSLIKGETGATGPQGPQGIQGPAGPNGVSQYVHIRYSANADGSGMTTAPQANTSHIGLANTTSATAPTANTAYSWSLFKGPQGNTGIQGPSGTNGVTTYTWVKYADTITGSGMSDTPSGKRFVGFAFNKTTATESSVASDYAWSPLYDNVVVGGRNVFLRSGNFENGVGSSWGNNGGGLVIDSVETWLGRPTVRTTVGAGIFGAWYQLENDVEYTFSAMIKSSEAFTGSGNLPLHYHAGLNNTNQSKISVISFDTSYSSSDLGKYKRLSVTFKLTGDANSFRPFIYFGSGTRIFNIAYLKLEKGNIATDWTPAPEDVDAAITYAQTTADGKNAVFYQTTAPSTSGRKVNDLWFDTDDGNRIYIFNGTSWAPAPFGTNAIAQLAITNALIANGTIQDAKIANVTAAKIIANSLSAISANLGTILAGHIEGVTLNLAGGKFIVDAFGNVTFKGNLDGASGTFSGKVTTPILDIENNGESGIRMLADKFGDYGAAAGLIKTIYTTATATYLLITGTNANDTQLNNDIIIDLDGKAVILGASPASSPTGGSNVSVSDEFTVAGLAEFFGALRAHMNADFYAPAHFWADVESENNIRLRGDANVVATDRPWFAPTLLNGVSNLSGYSAAAYTKEVTGRVRLKGFLQGSADNRVLFTLPVGFRPSERRVFICFSNHSTGRARVDIETNGNVTAVSSGNWVVLDGIEFPI